MSGLRRSRSATPSSASPLRRRAARPPLPTTSPPPDCTDSTARTRRRRPRRRSCRPRRPQCRRQSRRSRGRDITTRTVQRLRLRPRPPAAIAVRRPRRVLSTCPSRSGPSHRPRPLRTSTPRSDGTLRLHRRRLWPQRESLRLLRWPTFLRPCCLRRRHIPLRRVARIPLRRRRLRRLRRRASCPGPLRPATSPRRRPRRETLSVRSARSPSSRTAARILCWTSTFAARSAPTTSHCSRTVATRRASRRSRWTTRTTCLRRRAKRRNPLLQGLQGLLRQHQHRPLRRGGPPMAWSPAAIGRRIQLGHSRRTWTWKGTQVRCRTSL